MAQDDIQGQVVDGAGNPVSGAIVELTKSYQSNPVERGDVFRTTTDSNGNYIFTGHQEGDGTTQEWHVSCYNHDGTAYVNSFNNPGVTADLPSIAIPDSGLLHNYDFSDSSTTTSFVDDQKGTSDLDTGSFTSLTTMNNRQVGEFDGTDDELFTTTPNINKDDAYVFVVAKFAGSLPGSSKGEHVFGEEDANGWGFGVKGDSWHLNPFGVATSAGTADNEPHIFEVDAENGDQVDLYVDGSVAVSADDGGGNTTFGGLYVGRSVNFDYGRFDVGQVLIYDESQANKSDVRQALSAIWDINI